MTKTFSILTFILFGIIPAMAATVSGTIYDENSEPLVGANIVVQGTGRGDSADTDGTFKITNVPDNAKLEISSLGYETQTVVAGQNLKINMTPSTTAMEEITVAITGKTAGKQCDSNDLPQYATAGIYIKSGNGLTCAATKCKDNTYLVVNAKGESQGWCTTPIKCDSGKKFNIIDETKTDRKCVTDVNKMLEDTANKINQDNAKKTLTETETVTNTDDINFDVTDDELSELDTAPVNPNNKTVSNSTGTDKSATTPTEKPANNTPRLSHEDSLKKIDELTKNAENMRAKETSLANKTLGAAGIGATGIGGMQAASALAEQNADADAEEAMRAYLATFHCNYGDGKNIAGGTTNVEIPGGNELIGLYSEYVNLANSLKVRKNALGLRPGIEADPILNSATSGLYDDVSTGTTSGAYASLARALQNPDGPDAAAWAAQKSDTAQKLKTGLITAGVGAAGSMIGNIALNSGDKKRERSAEIIAKYDALKQVFVAFEQEINNTPPTETCKKHGATGTWPNCTCPDIKQYFSTNSGQCIPCENGGTFDGNNCVCNADQVLIDDKCTQKPQGCKLTGFVDLEKCQCKPGATGDDCHCDTQNSYYEKDNACKKCELTGQVDVKTCTCTANTININGTCKQQAGEIVYSDNFQADALFDIGKSTLKDKAKADIKDLITNINKDTQATEVIKSGSYCITITGHTDRTKFRTGSSMNNQKLSENRANAVKAELISAGNKLFSENNIKTHGKAASECTTEKYPKANDAQCRRVNITITVGGCDDQPSQSTDIYTTLINAGTNAVTRSVASNELKFPGVDEYTRQKNIETAKQKEVTLENIDTALENILNDHNIEPTEKLKEDWRTYAKKCRTYNGILTLTKFILAYDGFKATYDAVCTFTDYTTLTKKEYDTRMNDMGANFITAGVIMYVHITQDNKAILIK